MINEKSIIDQVLQGNDEAFAELVKAYEDKVYNLCLRMCSDREDARDLAQEAFVKAWRGLRFYKQESAFSTWLFRLTTNVCIDYLRQKKRRSAVSLTTDDELLQLDVPDPSPTPEEQVQQTMARQTVASAMEQLEEEFRTVLTLRVVEELSYEEIAEILDLKVGTVKSRLARAREKIKKILLKSGNDLFDHSVKKNREEDAL
ncbi:MAG: sigma-70 family RNA polymerase sigma factor [Oscillospiraceae bacterium]|nr:sigma-70 family RNA polymerase sigma factor [Oscillospiraceae bacterium]